MLFKGSPVGEPLYSDSSSAWLKHGPFGMWLIHALCPRKVVELGTHHGYSYFCFCQAVAEGGLDTRCFAVDTWNGDEHAGYYGDTVFRHVQKLNTPYAGFSTLLRKTFAEALDDIEDGSVDLLHVDGRHFYEDVRADFESWIPKLSRQAVVLFHDTEVRDREFGVWRYWAEVVGQKPRINFPYQHGLGVLFWGPEIASGLRSFVSMLGNPAQVEQVVTFFENAGEEAVHRAKLKVCATKIKDDLALALVILRQERRYPLQALQNKLGFKLLRGLTKATLLLPARTIARLQRSAEKRDPDRGLLG